MQSINVYTSPRRYMCGAHCSDVLPRQTQYNYSLLVQLEPWRDDCCATCLLGPAPCKNLALGQHISSKPDATQAAKCLHIGGSVPPSCSLVSGNLTRIWRRRERTGQCYTVHTRNCRRADPDLAGEQKFVIVSPVCHFLGLIRMPLSNMSHML